MPRPFSVFAIALLVSLSACAQLAPQGAQTAAELTRPDESAPVAAPGGDTTASASTTTETEAYVEPLPEAELTRQIVYQMLLAEIAAQRGSLPLAVGAYLDLAKTTRDPRIARRAAEIAHFARQNDAVMEATRLWIEIDPAATRARQLMAGLLANAGRYNESAPHVAFLLARDTARLPEALVSLNRLFARDEDKKAAPELVTRLTEPYLEYPEAHFARAQAAQAVGDDAAAIKESDTALTLRQGWDQAVILKAHVQYRKNAQQALETLQRHLASYSGARDVRLQYARMLTSEKRFEDARVQFRTLLAEFPDNGDVLFAVAALSFQLQDFDSADKGFRRLIELGHGDGNTVRMYLGQIAENRNRPAEAVEWYGGVGEGDQFVPAQIRLAGVLSAQGKLDEARARLQRAVTSNNRERVQLLLAEAQLLRDAGKVREAFDLLDRSVSAQPNQPELLYETALLADRVGRVDVLETNLRKVIALKPEHAHAYNALGYSLADRNERLDEAYALIRKGLEYAPDDPFILDSMGWVLYRRGELQRSVEYLQRAMKLRADPEIAAHLGEVMWALGRRDDAARTWRDAAKAHPGNAVLGNAIKRFLP